MMRIAARCLLCLMFGLGLSAARADGTLTHMSGPVSVLKADGTSQPGAPGVKALPGDTVMTGSGGYARMEMTDGGEIVLRPDSQLKIEGYRFVESKPAEDSFVFSMLKGGLRTVTGLIGKRGNRDAYELKTQTATIGIRGTQFDLRVCQANCGALADGTYLAVRFGAVQTANAQGSLAVAAGQAVHVPPQRPPVILPRDPGIGFTPPAVIPKLDEKKKTQSSAAAASAPEQAKPAASGQGSQSGATAKDGGKDAGKADGAEKSEASGKSESSGKSDSSGKSESGKNDASGKAEAGKSDGSAKTDASSKQEAPKTDAATKTSSEKPEAPKAEAASGSAGKPTSSGTPAQASPAASAGATQSSPVSSAAPAVSTTSPAAALFPASSSQPAAIDCSIQ